MIDSLFFLPQPSCPLVFRLPPLFHFAAVLFHGVSFFAMNPSHFDPVRGTGTRDWANLRTTPSAYPCLPNRRSKRTTRRNALATFWETELSSRSIATAAPIMSPSATGTATMAATTAIFARFGLIHHDGPTVVLFFVQPLDGCLRLSVIAHLHEAEPFALAGGAVFDNLSALDGAKGGKHLFQVGTTDVVAQITAIQFTSHDKTPESRNDNPIFAFRAEKKETSVVAHQAGTGESGGGEAIAR